MSDTLTAVEYAEMFEHIKKEFGPSLTSEVEAALWALFSSMIAMGDRAYNNGVADERVSAIAFLSELWPDAAAALQDGNHVTDGGDDSGVQ